MFVALLLLPQARLGVQASSTVRSSCDAPSNESIKCHLRVANKENCEEQRCCWAMQSSSSRGLCYRRRAHVPRQIIVDHYAFQRRRGICNASTILEYHQDQIERRNIRDCARMCASGVQASCLAGRPCMGFEYSEFTHRCRLLDRCNARAGECYGGTCAYAFTGGDYSHSARVAKPRTEKRLSMRSRIARQTNATEPPIDVLFMINNAIALPNLRQAAEKRTVPILPSIIRCMRTLLAHNTARVRVVLLGEIQSISATETALRAAFPALAVTTLELDPLIATVTDEVATLRRHFGNHPKYGDPSFFAPPLFFKMLPRTMHRLVMLDVDLVFSGDLKQITDHFVYLGGETLFAMAHEQAPVYRGVFARYREAHDGTALGEPRSRGGMPGYNAGVILMDLDAMRSSDQYGAIYADGAKFVDDLAKHYDVAKAGFLASQDLYILLAMQFPRMFHTLPCAFNRQLCSIQRCSKPLELAAHFDEYHRCPVRPVVVWHGNCNSMRLASNLSESDLLLGERTAQKQAPPPRPARAARGIRDEPAASRRR